MPAWRTISLWMDQLDEPLLARPALERDLDVDVAIIGAGYTGLWTAYYLKQHKPDLNIAIVEAQTAGFGASGRNGGWLMGNLLGRIACWPISQPKNDVPPTICCTAFRMKWKLSSNERGSTAITVKAGCCIAPHAIRSRRPACVITWTISTARASTTATIAG